ncbi:hypothetical protein [Zavarzinia sp. CC-PAN008]|uniref:hypothetical protein n=1 Tax=Zavarzinia sp. CC-PAN008 TaxID=3243332 RepID=UPI003F746466
MTADVVVLDHALGALRDAFIAWQCRVRAWAVRRNGGRPLPGMCPRVLGADGAEILPALTTVLLPADPRRATALFQQMHKRTRDPRERLEKALEMLAGTFFQKPAEFHDELTAVFAPGSATARRLLLARRATLEFADFAQGFRIPCRVEALAHADLARQGTWWHNALFNPGLAPDVEILALTPIWEDAEAMVEA